MLEQPRHEHHKMILVYTHPDGSDELYCPTCGRRILVKWPPNYHKTVLAAGDEYAIHSGNVGGLEIGIARPQKQREIAVQVADSHLSAQDEIRLAQWEEWLEQMDFENLWAA